MMIFSVSGNVYGQNDIQVGEEVAFFRESPHPYIGSQAPTISWRDTIDYTTSECSYLALFFKDVDLDTADKIVIRSLDSLQVYEYPSSLLMADTFWGVPIYGNSTIIEIHSENSSGGFGYVIDKIARGFTHDEFHESADRGSSCGADLMQAAKCYQVSEPAIYQHAVPVARIWRNATNVAGTGWLIGSEGHLITNAHVISGPNTTHTMRVEMMAEGSCGPGCNFEKACPGHFVKHMDGGAALIRIKKPLDYSLILLQDNPSNQYGYLQLRESGPVLDERVYIPNHGGGYGKRIAVHSDHPHDNGVVNISIIHDNNAQGYSCGQGEFLVLKKDAIEYRAHTTSKSSGSPVIAYNDNLVVGLHHCVFGETECHRRGINMLRILEDMTNESVLPQNAIGTDVDPCTLPYQDIEITEEREIWQDFYSTGNIILKSGANLRINASVFMREGTHILVERNARLIIAGPLGKVTRGCGAPNWKGIIVLGNSNELQPFGYEPLNNPNQAGRVVVNSGGIIEWAQVGISAGGGYSSEYWGGYVVGFGGIFRNNQLDIEMFPYSSQFNNLSWFYNCEFIGADITNSQGVWIWETDGISFNQCSFLGYDYEAIRAFDSAIRILDGNRFQGCEQAISLLATMPNPFAEKSQIGTLNMTPNQFQNNTFHITGWGPPRVDVLMNEFEGGTTGIHIAGSSRYNITGNSFEDMDRGVVLYSTGFNQSAISNLSCNQFAINYYGSIAVGDNQRTRYWGNQFDLTGTSSRDLMVSQFSVPGWALYPGQLYHPQGDIQFPTDNCFTEPGQKIDILTNGSTVHFDFFHRPSGTLTCGYEPLNPGNYTKYETSNQLPAHDCNQFVEGATMPGFHSLTVLDSMRQLLSELHPHTSSSIDTLVWYNQVWDEKESLLHHLVMAALDTNDMTSAEQIIQGENSVAADWAIYGLRLSRGDIIGAASWLAQMSDTSAVEQDFYDIQAIHLAYRLDTTGTFLLDSIQLSYLQDMAYGGSPVRDYARSLLGLLTGHRFYPEIPEVEAEMHSADQDTISWRQSDWKIYPIPANDELQLEWKVTDRNATWQIRIMDMMGRQLLTQNIQAASGHHLLYLDKIRNGIFYIAISSQTGEILHQSPFVIHR